MTQHGTQHHQNGENENKNKKRGRISRRRHDDSVIAEICRALKTSQRSFLALCLLSLLALQVHDLMSYLQGVESGAGETLLATVRSNRDSSSDNDGAADWPSYQVRMERFQKVLLSFNDSTLITTDTTFLNPADSRDSPFGNHTTGLFTVWLDEPMPSSQCFPASHLPHPLVYFESHPAHLVHKYGREPFRHGNSSDPISICSGPQFTQVIFEKGQQDDERDADNEDKVMFSMNCPNGGYGKWGKSLKELNNVWQHNDTSTTDQIEMPRKRTSVGVDWVYTSCTTTTTNSSSGNSTTVVDTNLRIHPRRLKTLQTTSEDGPETASVLLLIIDSVSHGLFDRDFSETNKLLQSREFKHITYRFPHTSVAGRNSYPNMAVIMEEPNLFRVARNHNVVTSAFEDYCKDHALCTRYPYKEHRVCSELLCNYRQHIIKLYEMNPKPGCVHGEFFIKHHLRYIQDHWKVYNKQRKLHIAKPYGCHLSHHNRYMCNSNDAPLAAFLKEFVPANPNTAVIFASDHGYHWTNRKGGFNNHIAGEFEHRNPFLGMILPWTSDDAVLRTNTERFVTHRDLHATVLGLLDPIEKQEGVPGIDLMRELVPAKRSCMDAGIPPVWCNCFRPKHNKTELSVQTELGIE